MDVKKTSSTSRRLKNDKLLFHSLDFFSLQVTERTFSVSNMNLFLRSTHNSTLSTLIMYRLTRVMYQSRIGSYKNRYIELDFSL